MINIDADLLQWSINFLIKNLLHLHSQRHQQRELREIDLLPVVVLKLSQEKKSTLIFYRQYL